MIYLELFYIFFIIGLSGFDGGYEMLSLVRTETVVNYHWLSSAEFTNIVAVSQMTPGPIGINSATYCGYTAVYNVDFGAGMAVLGSLTATIALVLPSLIIMILISKMFLKHINTSVVQSVFSDLRPVVVGLLAAAALLLCSIENSSASSINPWQFWINLFLFTATFVGMMWLKINPIRIICYAAFAGLILLYWEGPRSLVFSHRKGSAYPSFATVLLSNTHCVVIEHRLCGALTRVCQNAN